MKTILTVCVILLVCNVLFSFPAKIENIYKIEVYKYDTTKAYWRQTSLTEYFWDNNILNSEIDYYVQKDSSKIERFRKTYTFNSFGYLTDLLTNSSGKFYHNDSYSYDVNNRLIEETAISSDSGALRYDYTYSPQSDSIISTVFYSKDRGTSIWDTLSVSYYDRNSSGLVTNDSTFSYNMNSHLFYNGVKNTYLYDSLNNLIETDNYSIGNSGNLLKSKIINDYEGKKISNINSSFYSNGEVIISNLITYTYNTSGTLKQMIDSAFSLDDYTTSTVYDYDYETRGDTTVVTEIQTEYNLDVYNVSYKTVTYMFDSPNNVETPEGDPNRFLLYPNPATNSSMISLSLDGGATQNVEISVVDQSGRIIAKYFTQNVNGTAAIKCPKVPAGAYFIRAISDGRVVGTGRVVISK